MLLCVPFTSATSVSLLDSGTDHDTDCTTVSSWPATVNTARLVVELPKLAVTTTDPVDSACIREPDGSTTAVSEDAKLERAVTSYDVAVSSDRYASARADAWWYVLPRHCTRPTVVSTGPVGYPVKSSASDASDTSGTLVDAVSPYASSVAVTVTDEHAAPESTLSETPDTSAQPPSSMLYETRESDDMSLLVPSSKLVVTVSVAVCCTLIGDCVASSSGADSRASLILTDSPVAAGSAIENGTSPLPIGSSHTRHSTATSRLHSLIAPNATSADHAPSEPALTSRLLVDDVTFRTPLEPYESTSCTTPSLHVTREKIRPVSPSADSTCDSSTAALNDDTVSHDDGGCCDHATPVTMRLVSSTIDTRLSVTPTDVDA